MTSPTNLPFYASSFAAGAIVLFLELAGARWLAPTFGSGLDVWASLLTVTLLAIALGAWGGGVLADKHPRLRTLALVWFGASLSIAWLLPLRNPVLRAAGSLPPGWGALVSSILLYLPALILLSAAAPLAVRLAAPSPDSLGRVVGRFSAVGTAGSCLGALLTGFLLVPHFPLTRLFAGAAFTAALVGLALLPGALRRVAPPFGVLMWGVLLFILSVPSVTGNLSVNGGTLLVQEARQSLYGQIRVIESNTGRYLFLDGILQGGRTLADGATIASYSMLMEALGRAVTPKPERVLVLGLGAALLPNRFQSLGARVDVAEINGQMAAVAERWFDFHPPEGALFVMDGRRFLREASGPYDLIMMDTFSGEEVPGHLITVETFRRCRELLRPSGALVLNYIGNASGVESRVPASVAATLRRAFESVEVFALGPAGERDNLVLVAKGSGVAWDKAPTDIPGPSPEEQAKLAHLMDYRRTLPDTDVVFTDDWHPLDWLDRKTRLQWRRDALSFTRQSGVEG